MDIETLVDNGAKDHRLRVAFPSHMRCDVSHAAEPWDVVERPVQLPDLNAYPDEKQSAVNPQGGFVDVSDGQAGLMIAGQGLYEYEVTATPDRRICVTLLRCLQQLHPGPFWDSAEMQMHEAQCLGTTTFRYSIIPHAGGWQSAMRDAYEFRYPVRVVRQQPLEEEQLPDFEPLTVARGLPQGHSFVEVEPKTLIVSAVKKHETRESLIIRLWNPDEETVAGRLRVAAPGYRPAGAYRTNLHEEREEELPLDDANWIPCAVRGKGLLTLELAARH